jgi:hypothetical protein
MSKIQDYAKEFLQSGGRKLGYDWDNMPEVKDFKIILTLGIQVWEYFGQTEYEYYMIDENEGR